MVKELDILAFLKKAEEFPVIDVRTPSEFRQGHIPGAFNIPLFSDEERKRVGTTYKQKGQRDAIFEGLEYAGPKMIELAKLAGRIAETKHPGNSRVLVHCWRGGMRSASMAWLFSTTGLEPVLLTGGYKSFRRHVLSRLDTNRHFAVVGGLTGSGKTDILQELEKLGEQVLDLERLANHKGSAFGSLGEGEQNTNEQFENEIHACLDRKDDERIIWIEDESRTIGKNTLPAGIYRSIRTSTVIFLDLSFEERVQRLVRDYARFPVEELIDAVLKIKPRLGDRDARLAMEGIRSGDFLTAVSITLRYYDKTYRFGLGKRDPETVFPLAFSTKQPPAERSLQILEFVRQKRIFVKHISNSTPDEYDHSNHGVHRKGGET